MKILQVISRFNPLLGGTVYVISNLSKHLVQLGHDVTILTTDTRFDDHFAHEVQKSGVKIVKLHAFFNVGLFIYSPDIKKWLDGNIKDYDIIHLNAARAYQNNIVATYARRYNVPYVIQTHGSLPRIMKMRRLKYLYDLVWGNSLLNNCVFFIALHRREEQQLIGIGIDKEKIEIVPNGFDLPEYIGLPSKGEFRKKYSISKNMQVILFLGRINEIKGIDLLVSAFADLILELENALLVIVGPDDGFMPNIKKQIHDLQIENNVLITGPLYGVEKVEAFIDSDLYVLPSIYETFPISVLEAFSYGVPVIITDRCGLADIIDKKAGYVVGYDKDQLKSAIIRTLRDNDLKRSFVEEGKRLVRNSFNWGVISREVEYIYKVSASKKSK